MFEYEGRVFRPPSEAYSLIVQVTIGCSHNKCTFCDMYKEKRFRVRKLEDVKADFDEARRMYRRVDRIFLADGDALMGRNYDFKNDTSSMLVYCAPKNGYRSVAFAALDNVSANTPEANMKQKLATLTAPFICLDGLNEKGVSIAVLTLDSEPTYQQTGKPMIATTLAIRLVLDRAATTQEAVDLLRGYDMFASSGRDYHFYITDSTGDGRVIEYDCESETRELKDTPMRAITNFYGLYIDQVLPNQKNGIYGHGRERYDAMEAIFDAQEGAFTEETAWDALKAAQQLPNPEDITSNTQWSIVYNNTDLTAKIVLRRHWDDVTAYALTENKLIEQ